MFRPCWISIPLVVLFVSIAMPADRIETRPISDDVVSAWQRSFLAAREAQRGQDWAAAALIFDDTLRIAEQLPEGSPRLVWTVEQLAAVSASVGRPHEAVELYERLLGLCDKDRVESEPTTAIALGRLARIHARLGDLERAEQLYRRELELRETAPEDQPISHDTVLYRLALLIGLLRPDDSEADELIERFITREPSARRHLQVAEFHLGRDNFDRAIDHFQLGLQLSVNRSESERRLHAELTFGLARAYQGFGRFDQAELEYHVLLRAQEADLGPRHPSIARTLSRLGASYEAQQRWTEAETALLGALRLTQGAWGSCQACLRGPCDQLAAVYEAIDSEPPASCIVVDGFPTDGRAEQSAELVQLDGQVAVLVRTGRYDAAVDLAREALQLRRSLFGEVSMGVADGLANLARIYERQIRLPLASSMQNERLRLLEQLLPDGDERIPPVLQQLGRLALRRGLDDEARRHLLREMALREPLGHRLRVIRIHETLGRLDHKAGRPTEAASHFVRAAECWAELVGGETPAMDENLTAADESREGMDDQGGESIAQRNPKSPSL